MLLQLLYLGRSNIARSADGLAVSLAPNLRRDRVSYVGLLEQPLRFREAISALHDVVISDLRFKAKDHTAYREYLAEQKKREAQIYHAAVTATRRELKKEQPAMPPGLEQRFQQLRRVYWDARQKYSNYLLKHDPELWRLLMPCDPVITVANDILFFECFSADESSYGCLSVDRNAFHKEEDVALGTTNVDYSWALYEHFQKLRSYRQTRFQIDPAGFEVKTVEAEANYREEKIDLPPSWLRGFMQLQSAMSLPMRRVPFEREGLYSILAWLKRHRARKSPRAIRFELDPGQPVQVVLEPWEKRIVVHGTKYPGPRAESLRVWGRDRLFVLARLLPLMDSLDVYLLGTGLPSFWVVRMGEMRLTLGLSGWTVNDWTGASALDQLMPPAEPSKEVLGDIAATFKQETAQTFEQIRQKTGAAAPFVAAGLNRLALLGQVIHDLPAGLFRWRQVMPVALSMEQIGPENPETVGARQLAGKVKVTQNELMPSGLRVLGGVVADQQVELLINGDGLMMRGKCPCSHHRKGGLRRGPCRHLQALRSSVLAGQKQPNLERWYEKLWVTS
ncbi:MAG: hypothetical protein AB7K24_03170 [Gemmataceae bacterium]